MSEENKVLKKTETDEIPVEVYVGQELGSTGSIKVLAENDSRQNTLLIEPEILALSYFALIPKAEGGEYARDFIEEYQRRKMSLGGWRANQLIRLVSGSKGVGTEKIVKKPGIIGRTITNRGWKEKAEREGAVIVE